MELLHLYITERHRDFAKILKFSEAFKKELIPSEVAGVKHYFIVFDSKEDKDFFVDVLNIDYAHVITPNKPDIKKINIRLQSEISSGVKSESAKIESVKFISPTTNVHRSPSEDSSSPGIYFKKPFKKNQSENKKDKKGETNQNNKGDTKRPDFNYKIKGGPNKGNTGNGSKGFNG